jgi:hypothetical protein
MENLQLTELTEEEMIAVDGGQANDLTCAVVGGVFVFTAATGNVVGAIMAGVYLYTNRAQCLSL